MATPDFERLTRSRGELIVAPTSLSTARPHGGTSLGIVSKVRFQPGDRWIDVPAEDRGGEIQESYYVPDRAVLRATLRSPSDDDVKQRVWPNSASGSVTGKRVASAPGTVRPGFKASTRTVVLLWSPDEPLVDDALILYKAHLRLVREHELAYGLDEEKVLVVEVVLMLGEGSDRLWKEGLLEDLTL